MQVDKHWAATAEIDLRQYWQVVSRDKFKIVGLALGVSLLAALWVFSVEPVYEATATLLIESGAAKVVSIEEVYSPDSNAEEYYATQFELLNSPTVANKVIDELALMKSPEFESLQGKGKGAKSQPAADARARQRTVGAYLERLDIAPINKTRLVAVTFAAHDPALAASIANTHARNYIADMLATKLDFSESATDWMSERLQDVSSKLRRSEQALQEFREREQVFDAEGLQSLSSKNLNELTSRLVETQRELQMAQSAARQIERVQQTDSDSEAKAEQLESIPAVSRNALVQRFKEQKATSRRAIAELGKTYGPKHPKFITAVAEFKTASGNLRRQISIVVEGVKKQYAMAQAEEQALRESIEEAKQQYHLTGRKESELLNLQREVQTNRQLYDIFYNRMQETAETGGLQYANARVVAPALAPLEPVRPNQPLTIVMAFFGSLVLGVLIAFVRESFDNTLKSSADVERILQQPLLGAIPKLKTANGKPLELGRMFLNSDRSSDHNADAPYFKEAIRTIRTAITLSAQFKPHKMLMLTSAVSGEGKSVTALNLAYAFGQLDQVLLVECDLRRPTLGAQLEIPADMPGISQLLTNEAKLEECIVYPEADKIQFITAGAAPHNPLELLSSPAFTALMLQLRHDYDLVILDCPPILPISDATVIASKMDAAIFVARAGSTPVEQIKAGLEKLRDTNVTVLGVVANALENERAPAPYGGRTASFSGSSDSTNDAAMQAAGWSGKFAAALAKLARSIRT